MSNRVAINAKPTTIDGDHSDASASEKPTGQVIPTGALRCRYSNAKDTNSFDSPSPPVSHPYYRSLARYLAQAHQLRGNSGLRMVHTDDLKASLPNTG